MSSSLQKHLTHPRSPSNRLYYEEQLSPDWAKEINDVLAQETLFNLAPLEISFGIESIALWKFNYLQEQQGVFYKPAKFDFLGLPLLCQRKILEEVDQKTFLDCHLVSRAFRAVCESIAKQRIFTVAELQIRQNPDSCLIVRSGKTLDFSFPTDFKGHIYAKSVCIESQFFDTTKLSIPSTLISQLSKVKCETLWIKNMLTRVTDEAKAKFLRSLIETLVPKFVCGGPIGNLLSPNHQLEGLTAILTMDDDFLAVRAKRLKVFQGQFSFSAVNVILKEWQSGSRDLVKMEISWMGGRGGGESELLRELGAEIRNDEMWIKKKTNGQMARIRIGPTTFTMKELKMELE